MKPFFCVKTVILLCCFHLASCQQSDSLLTKQMLINDLKGVLMQDKDFLELAQFENERKVKLMYNYFNLLQSDRNYILENRGKATTREERIAMYEKAGIIHPDEYFDGL